MSAGCLPHSGGTTPLPDALTSWCEPEHALQAPIAGQHWSHLGPGRRSHPPVEGGSHTQTVEVCGVVYSSTALSVSLSIPPSPLYSPPEGGQQCSVSPPVDRHT